MTQPLNHFLAAICLIIAACSDPECPPYLRGDGTDCVVPGGNRDSGPGGEAPDGEKRESFPQREYDAGEVLVRDASAPARTRTGEAGTGGAGGAAAAADNSAGAAGSAMAMMSSMQPQSGTGGVAAPSAECGNGKREGAEICDGDCETECAKPNKCFTAQMKGSPATCDVSCETTEISACVAGDDCCPMGCSHAEDSDCSLSCGDGEVTGVETCETSSIEHPCPTLESCDDHEPCTKDMITGSAQMCSAACAHKQITEKMAGDKCCPKGANANDDNDCKAECGNKVVEPGETCDGDCPTTTECRSSGCMGRKLMGSGCDVTCVEEAITRRVNGDGCCPSGSNSTNDNDCKAECGNGVREGSELCDGDCPTSCDDGNACSKDELVGSASMCNAACRHGSGTQNACGGCGSLDHAPGSECSATQNSCVTKGKYECQGSDSVRCNAATPTASSEKCDGSDNDCDGRIDEGVKNTCGGCTALKAAVGATCLAEGPGCANQGKYECDGKEALRCTAAPCLCGNGVVDAGETCDVSVPGGNPGSCPLACNDNDPCTRDSKVGSLCSTACLYVPTTGCNPDDPPAVPENFE